MDSRQEKAAAVWGGYTKQGIEGVGSSNSREGSTQKDRQKKTVVETVAGARGGRMSALASSEAVTGGKRKTTVGGRRTVERETAPWEPKLWSAATGAAPTRT